MLFLIDIVPAVRAAAGIFFQYHTYSTNLPL